MCYVFLAPYGAAAPQISCYLRELDTIALPLNKSMMHVNLLFRAIAPDFNKFLVCVKFLLCAIALLRRKFHAACYFRELDTIALHFKIVLH